jgi:3-methyladenine DNA glycosylase/8-oxoguanine DNA glycosylase
VFPDVVTIQPLDGPLDARHALPGYHLASDPTRRARPDGSVVFAARSPEGPVTTKMVVANGAAQIECWGPGSGWMAARGPQLTGAHDDPRPLQFDHDAIDELNRRFAALRHGATGVIVDGLLARTLGQRVLAREAGRSWSALCRALGDDAPGPFGLVLAPDPERVAGSPPWWFHQHGVDRGRATTLVAVARHARRLEECTALPLPKAYGRMRAIPGLGPWTVNGVARNALGDPDAIVVGDYWICHQIVSFLTGRARGSDAEMLELVERWTGQRGRVERLVAASGHRIQRFGPGVRTPRISTM